MFLTCSYVTHFSTFICLFIPCFAQSPTHAYQAVGKYAQFQHYPLGSDRAVGAIIPHRSQPSIQSHSTNTAKYGKKPLMNHVINLSESFINESYKLREND